VGEKEDGGEERVEGKNVGAKKVGEKERWGSWRVGDKEGVWFGPIHRERR
jgi:hypothetical protein